jgi:2-dehydro-3-deoxyphosphogluconate aldolase / (4S)-4-hydroxy-2-oxoglutarate aldolase
VNEWLRRVGEIGVVPVIKIEDAGSAVPLGNALLAGELPVAEITFRTAAAEEAIRNLAREVPALLVGAGTVLTVEQARRALGAGARFIVSPGFNTAVIDHCLAQGVPVIPGISTPTEIERGLERGLELLKFFPAGASGGLPYLRAIAAPYAGVKFMPTGGIEPSSLGEYAAFERVHAVGGTWIATSEAIAAGRFDEIARLAREAVFAMLGFEVAHVGLNEVSAERAGAVAGVLGQLFSFAARDGSSSLLVGGRLEVMKAPYLGAHGHLAIATFSLPRAISFLARQGIAIKPETMKEKDGRPIAVYLDLELAGFAVHLLQR